MGPMEFTQPTQQVPTQATQLSPTQLSLLGLHAPNCVCRFICTQGNYDAFDLVLDSDKTEWIFGRLVDADLRLTTSLRFSNKHFKVWLEPRDKALWIRDTSTNGTLLNGTRLVKGTNYTVNQGDEIAVGIGVPSDVVRFVVLFAEAYNPATRAAQNACQTSSEEGIFKDYIISHETIGQGAFATVKKAVNRKTAKSYAVKIINRRKALNTGGAGGIDGVERELSILQKLHHPNVVALENFYEDTENYYIVMELVPGGDLMDFVAANGAIGEDACQVITKQVLEGIAYVHNLGISHRDLKPDNILIMQDDPILVKITDFGLAKFSDNSSFMKTFCGTLAYVAPEVITGKYEALQLSPENAQYSSLVDIWSLGCLVYVLLTQHLPFNGKNQAQMFQKIKEGAFHEAPLHAYEVSSAGREFLKACLQVDPRQRMSAQEALKHEWIAKVYDEESQLQKVLSLSQSQSQQLRKIDNGLSLGMSMSRIDEDVMVRPLDRTKKPRNDFKVPKRVVPLPQSQPHVSSQFHNSSQPRVSSQFHTSSQPRVSSQLCGSPTSAHNKRVLNDSQEVLESKRRHTESHCFVLEPIEHSLLKEPIRVPNDQHSFVIGRIETSDYHIDDDRISKIHCVMVRKPGNDGIWLLDMSTNLCSVNAHTLGKGNKIKLCHDDTVCLFLDELLHQQIAYRLIITSDQEPDPPGMNEPEPQNEDDSSLINDLSQLLLGAGPLGETSP